MFWRGEFGCAAAAADATVAVSDERITQNSLPKHAYHVTNTETDFREPGGSPVKVRLGLNAGLQECPLLTDFSYF